MEINTHVLSAAELDDALIQKALGRGIEIDVCLFVHTQPVQDEQMEKEIAELEKIPATVVFTSANAIRAVSPATPNWHVYCIGHATRHAALTYFESNAIKGSADNGEALAKKIVEDGLKEVVFFCGDKRLDVLPGYLRTHGVVVREWVVYRTIETPVAVTKRYDGVMLYSPSGVNSFFSGNKVARETTLFAIGDTTAAAIRKHTDNVVIVSESPSRDALVNKVIEYYQQAAIKAGK